MPYYDPLFVFFGKLLEPLGCPHGTTARKLQLVYVHWTVWVAFLGVGWLVYRRAAKDPSFPKSVFPKPALIFMSVYCLIAGVLFFNRIGLTHYMFFWPIRLRLQSMLWSIFVVAAPTTLIYLIVSVRRHDFRSHLASSVCLFLVFHAATTLIYVLCPFVAIE